MKRLLLFSFLIMAFELTGFCQNKKVAVMETKTNDGVSSFQSNMVRGGMEAAVANAPGYVGYDRAAFDVIMKEQNFQRSGAVDDSQIKKMGQMAGVQYVLVTEAGTDGNGFYILAKILDVETGQMGKVVNIYCNALGQDIYNASNELGTQLFGDGFGMSSRNDRTPSQGQDFTETVFDIDMRMIYVEGGTFIMGCTSEQGNDCFEDEYPSRKIDVSSFYIGMLEVTQRQWEKVMGTTVSDIFEMTNLTELGWDLYEIGDEYPMYYVEYEEAKKFCQLLSQKAGKAYRLPTEAEWEYAARGGKYGENTKYSGSNDINQVAWYSKNCNASLHPCGTKRPNALGLFDMSGNETEWCDGFIFFVDSDNEVSGLCPVYRGGSIDSDERCCRVSTRFHYHPMDIFQTSGFRVVMDP